MNKATLITVMGLLQVTVAGSQTREGWVVAHCPFAAWTHSKGTDNSASFAIKHSNDKPSHYNCFSCMEHGDLMDLLLELKRNNVPADYKRALPLITTEEDSIELDIPDYEDEESTVVEKVVVWDEKFLQSFVPAFKSKDAMTYLRGRGVPNKVIEQLDLRWDSKLKRVCFPIRNWKGGLVGLHGRDVTNQSPLPYFVYKYKGACNKIVWYGESWIDPDEPVVLVESVFDLASVYRVYRNVLCSLTCGVSVPKIQRVSAISEFVTLYDYGEGGDRARAKLAKGLKQSTITHLSPTEDEDDPGAMSSCRVAMLLQDYVSLDKALL